MRKFVALTVLVILSFLPFSKAFAYDDVKGKALEKEIRAMADLEVVKGYPDGKFGPDDKVTRAQFAAFIARALELPEGPHAFADVKEDYTLVKEINAAAAAKIINGFPDNSFKPGEYVTRGQIALMINNALNYMKVEPKTAAVTFVDQSSFSPAAKIAISNMVGHKITSGYPVSNGSAFKPAQTAKRMDAAAFISRLLQAQEDLKGYRIASVSTDGKITHLYASYATLEEAEKALKNPAKQVIAKDGKIVKMQKDSGIAFTTPKGKDYTTLYSKLPFSDANVYGGVVQKNEMKYVTSDEEKVTVEVAGQQVYVKHNEVTLLPFHGMSGRTHYTKHENGDLLLVRYDHVNKKQLSTTIVGKAPSVFAVRGIYYSWDGAKFTDKNGKDVGTYYQYFNMLPLRTTTNYTAAELDKVIMQNLVERESYYKKNPSGYDHYKDATKKSKLIGLGKKLKEIEAEHNINALLMLGIAMSESDFGMSEGAQLRNNLFGIGAHDDNPGKSYSYETPEESFEYLVTAELNKEYLYIKEKYPEIAVLGDKASGGMLGNKARGVNVRYASDPYWGQNIAGHVYLMDKVLGGKDFLKNENPYKLFITNSFLNVRSSEGAMGNTNLLFTYPRPGYVVASVEENGKWTKILSDNYTNKYAYVSSEYLDLMTIAK